jgi:hypothetical protein
VATTLVTAPTPEQAERLERFLRVELDPREAAQLLRRGHDLLVPGACSPERRRFLAYACRGLGLSTWLTRVDGVLLGKEA